LAKFERMTRSTKRRKRDEDDRGYRSSSKTGSTESVDLRILCRQGGRMRTAYQKLLDKYKALEAENKRCTQNLDRQRQRRVRRVNKLQENEQTYTEDGHSANAKGNGCTGNRE
jgi:hypothetical protein